MSATSAKAAITVKWTPVKGCLGYYVYRKTAKSGWVRVGVVNGVNASSYLDKPVSPDVVLLGEIGLSGELRAVQGSNQRIQEIKRLGYKKCILPLGCKDDNVKINDIELVYVRDVGEAIKAAF